MNPDFWIEINRRDDTQTHIPFLGTMEEAEKRIVHLVAMDPHNFIDFCVLLRGDFIPGQVATDSQILADTQSYPVPGAVRYPTINRPRRKQNANPTKRLASHHKFSTSDCKPVRIIWDGADR